MASLIKHCLEDKVASLLKLNLQKMFFKFISFPIVNYSNEKFYNNDCLFIYIENMILDLARKTYT